MRANGIAPKISPKTFARSAATSRTCRSGSNAALIIQPFGARSIRVAITPRSMGTSSGTKAKRGNPLSFWTTSGALTDRRSFPKSSLSSTFASSSKEDDDFTCFIFHNVESFARGRLPVKVGASFFYAFQIKYALFLDGMTFV